MTRWSHLDERKVEIHFRGNRHFFWKYTIGVGRKLSRTTIRSRQEGLRDARASGPVSSQTKTV
jgi:hypothetical protein